MSSHVSPPPRCFQGVVPAMVATCDRHGTPNVTYLSQVFRIDDAHVALSCQFFNKTKQNVLENPFACVQLIDPVTFEVYRLELRYERAETSGALFDTMALRIQAIASHTGMSGVFRLISADVYEVIACERLDEFLMPAADADVVAAGVETPPAGPRSELKGLHLLSQRVCRARTLDELLATVLQTLDEGFGFGHAIVFLPDETGARLFALASRGYGESGVGAEVALGQGLIGTVARERRMLRLSGVDAELRYGRAIRATIAHSSARGGLAPEVPLPGLPDAQSHLAMPLVVGDRLVGVLAVESREPLGFDEWDEAFLEIVANQVASALDGALLREANEASGDEPSEAAAAPAAQAAPSPTERTLRFRFFRNDDCVFVGDEYLIRNVPGRILWKILRAYNDSRRTEFSNRELRLDPWLGLPPLRDNLESRLVLLRKRLEQKCPELRLVPTSRGHFRLETGCALSLQEAEDAG